MSGRKRNVLLDGGRDLDVSLTAGAAEFITRMLRGTAAKSGAVILKAHESPDGRPLVAVYVGRKHVGFLPPEETADLLPVLSACERAESTATARGRLTAPADNAAGPALTVSLDEAARLLDRVRPNDRIVTADDAGTPRRRVLRFMQTVARAPVSVGRPSTHPDELGSSAD